MQEKMTRFHFFRILQNSVEKIEDEFERINIKEEQSHHQLYEISLALMSAILK